jgi:hypothetical protein
MADSVEDILDEEYWQIIRYLKIIQSASFMKASKGWQ